MNQETARKIMGLNMIGTDDLAMRFNVRPSLTQQKKLSVVQTPLGRVIDEDELQFCRNSHILVAVLPVFPFEAHGDFQHQLFANEASKFAFLGAFQPIDECKVGWYLIRGSSRNHTYGQIWEDQIRENSFPNPEEVPDLYLTFYAMAAYFLKTGVRLFPDKLMRCGAIIPGEEEYQAAIGFKGFEGIQIKNIRNDSAEPFIGLASMARLAPTAP